MSCPKQVAVGICNVRDFGAVGDGKADDGAAIRSAVEMAETASGIVHFPAASYNLRRRRS